MTDHFDQEGRLYIASPPSTPPPGVSLFRRKRPERPAESTREQLQRVRAQMASTWRDRDVDWTEGDE